MRPTLLYAADDVRVEDVADPKTHQPTDAVVRIVLSCICGSDLWPYKSLPPTGTPATWAHEFLGVVEETGSEVRGPGSPTSPSASATSCATSPSPAASPPPASRSSCRTSSTARSGPAASSTGSPGLEDTAEGYRAMNDREALKVLIRP